MGSCFPSSLSDHGNRDLRCSVRMRSKLSFVAAPTMTKGLKDPKRSSGYHKDDQNAAKSGEGVNDPKDEPVERVKELR